MKNLNTFLVLLTAVQIGLTQCPQNTVPGSTFSEFNWTANTFEMYIKDYPEANGANPPYTIPSPFSIANNSAQFNPHYALDLCNES